MGGKKVQGTLDSKGPDFSELVDLTYDESEQNYNQSLHQILGYRMTLEYCKHFFIFEC